MATKPASVPQWDSNNTNTVSLLAAHKTDGWAASEIPTSAESNEWMREVYLWLDYLNKFLTTGGAATDNVDTAGNANFGGTLAAGGLITASAGLTAAANQHVAVSGSGRLKHGAREMSFPSAAYYPDSNAGSGSHNPVGYWTGWTGTGEVMCPIPIEVGKRITSFTQYYNVNGTGVSMTPKLVRIALATGTITTVSSGSGDNTGSALESQTVSGINHVVLTGNAYYLAVTVTNASHRVHGGTVTYDDP